jgi:hypothetical protein
MARCAATALSESVRGGRNPPQYGHSLAAPYRTTKALSTRATGRAATADYVLAHRPIAPDVGSTGDLPRLIDGLFFVVNRRHSKCPLLEDGRDALCGSTCGELGAVLPDVAAEKFSYFGHYSAASDDAMSMGGSSVETCPAGCGAEASLEAS